MRFNPFRPGSPVPPGMFTGRLKEVDTLEKALFQTKHGNPQHVLITGERGIGKSSLLLYLDAVAQGVAAIPSAEEFHFHFVVLRFEPHPNEELRELLRRLALSLTKLDTNIHDIKAKAQKLWAFVQRIEAGGFKLSGGPESAPQVELDDFTDSICEFLQNLGDERDGLLLVVDEADRAEKCDFGSFCKILTERVQRSSSNRLGLVLAGLPALTDLLVSSHESSLRIFEHIELTPLKNGDRKEVVLAGLKVAAEKGDPVTITDDALESISQMSDGYPQFIQQFAHSAFEATTDNIIDLEDFRNGLWDAISQLAAKYFRGPVLQGIFSDDYRTVLAALAKSSDGWVTKAQIRERTKLKDSQITNALTTLKQKQLIVPKEGVKGVYRLPSKAFAIWIIVALKAPPAPATLLGAQT